jgi:hypothetical protein
MALLARKVPSPLPCDLSSPRAESIQPKKLLKLDLLWKFTESYAAQYRLQKDIKPAYEGLLRQRPSGPDSNARAFNSLIERDFP